MSKLIITADIHGSISAWNEIAGLIEDDDTLAIAGDLFGTRYGDYNNPDYQPEEIKDEFKRLTCPKYFVNGNCDRESFFTGQATQLSFNFAGLTFFLNHGHYSLPDLTDYDIIIEGHSHIARLDMLMGKVFLNPGSPVLPRKNGPTYAVLENRTIKIISMKNRETQFYLKI